MNNSVKPNLKKKISVIDTLRSLPLNKEVIINNCEIKSNVIRSVSSRLKKKDTYLISLKRIGLMMFR